MRRAFIAFGIGAFLVYCWASVVYQNKADVPGYRLVSVDLLDGMPRERWDADTQAQFQRLMELEAKHYQLPEDAVVPAGKPGEAGAGRHLHADADGNIPADLPLSSDDFAWIIASAPRQQVTMMLRDASAVYELLDHHYLLRDSIPDPGNPDGPPLFVGGSPLDKAMLDHLRARGIGEITVTGHAEPVNFQLGTSLMVAIIFLTLTAALKPILWDPFLVMLEKRRRELEIGSEAERQNQLEAVRYQAEVQRRNAELEQKMQELRLREQRETARQAGEIIAEAREREKAAKVTGLRALVQEADQAERDMDSQIPELAEAIVRVLTPGLDGPRWDKMDVDGTADSEGRGD